MVHSNGRPFVARNERLVLFMIHVQSNNDRLCFFAVLVLSWDANDIIWLGWQVYTILWIEYTSLNITLGCLYYMNDMLRRHFALINFIA